MNKLFLSFIGISFVGVCCYYLKRINNRNKNVNKKQTDTKKIIKSDNHLTVEESQALISALKIENKSYSSLKYSETLDKILATISIKSEFTFNQDLLCQFGCFDELVMLLKNELSYLKANQFLKHEKSFNQLCLTLNNISQNVLIQQQIEDYFDIVAELLTNQNLPLASQSNLLKFIINITNIISYNFKYYLIYPYINKHLLYNITNNNKLYEEISLSCIKILINLCSDTTNIIQILNFELPEVFLCTNYLKNTNNEYLLRFVTFINIFLNNIINNNNILIHIAKNNNDTNFNNNDNHNENINVNYHKYSDDYDSNSKLKDLFLKEDLRNKFNINLNNILISEPIREYDIIFNIYSIIAILNSITNN